MDKYSNVCCVAFFFQLTVCSDNSTPVFNMLAQRFVTRNNRRSANPSANWLRQNDLNGIGMNSNRKWSPE